MGSESTSGRRGEGRQGRLQPVVAAAEARRRKGRWEGLVDGLVVNQKTKEGGAKEGCSPKQLQQRLGGGQDEEEDEEGWLMGSESTSGRRRGAPRLAAARSSSCSKGTARGRTRRRTG